MTRTNEENQNRRRLWTEEEDKILKDYVSAHGEGQWNRVATKTGLKRCGKSCRLRWMNYLAPDVKRGDVTQDAEALIIRLHKLLGNRWSLIAKRVPGRTDNQVKNYWNTHLIKKLAAKEQNGKLGITEQGSKMDVSSSKSCEESKVPNTVADASSSPCIQSSTSDEITMGKGKTSEVLDTQEPLMNDGYVTSFWIANDPLELNAFSSMDFLEGYYFNLA